MAKTKLTGAEDTEVLPPEPTETQTLVPAGQDTETGAMALAGGGPVSGEIDRSDVQLPSLKIVQAVGELSALHPQGSLVLDNQYVISEGGKTPVSLTVVKVRKYYVEDLPYDGEARPRLFNTLAEVKAAGLTTEWVGEQRPSAQPVLQCLVVVHDPGNDPALFPYEGPGGKNYALAFWKIRGVAYTAAGKPLLTALSLPGKFKEDPTVQSWTLATERVKKGKNWIYTPIFRKGPQNPQELVEFIKALAQI